MTKKELADHIKSLAEETGFIACGIAEARYLKEYAPAFNKWLENGFQAQMDYMERNNEKRTDPRKLVEGAKSAISVLFNYTPEKELPKENNYHISRYAYGKDYHFVMKKKLWELLEKIGAQAGKTQSRVFVDTAPVLDRAWAELAGIGWIGKNSMLISPKHGSYVFIGEIITDLELEYDSPMNNLCGGCTRCLEACPTGAIIKDGVIDSNKCIPYWTIEHRGEDMPEELQGQFEDNIFGCDICQEVCPWNRFAKPTREESFRPHPDLFDMTKEKWHNLSEEEYRKLFKKSAVKRAKFSGLKRNINFAAGKKKK